jgi:S1-C subfamily serine protease
MTSLILIWIGIDNTHSKAQNEEIPSYLTQEERNTVEIYQTVGPQVVFVHNIQVQYELFSLQAEPMQRGAGSGFIWDKKGHIVTNYHVVDRADKIAVTLQNGKTLPAKVIGGEPRKDIAVIKVEKLPEKFQRKIAIADSSKLVVGQKTVVIGNPYGLDQSLSTGVVSALGRPIPGYGNVTIRDMIQTDAAINPGNSGGPLLNSQGEVIGINTQIFSQTGSYVGLGFAVPSNTVKRIVNQIIKHGKVIQPGIGFQRLDDTVARRLGIQGVIIGRVLEDTPAEKVGLRGTKRLSSGRIRLGDVITKVDKQKIKNYDDLYNALEKKKIGEEVEITYLRDGNKKSVELELIGL